MVKMWTNLFTCLNMNHLIRLKKVFFTKKRVLNNKSRKKMQISGGGDKRIKKKNCHNFCQKHFHFRPLITDIHIFQAILRILMSDD